MIMDDVIRLGKEAGLHSFEQVRPHVRQIYPTCCSHMYMHVHAD